MIRDAETEALIRTYAKPIFDAAGLGSQAIEIHIVNDRSFNAFVVDGHNMFIHAGTLMEAKTPNQVIGVIAHESGHIVGGHLARLRAQLVAREIGGADAATARACGHGGGSAWWRARPWTGGNGRRLWRRGRGDAAASSPTARTRNPRPTRPASSFLNATHQSGRGMLETFENMSSKLIGVQGINPYLQTHPHAAAAPAPASRARDLEPLLQCRRPARASVPPRPRQGEALRLPRCP